MSPAFPSITLELPTRRATKQLASALAKQLAPGDLIILLGGLGAGKTFLTRAIGRALGIPYEERLTSPTFAVVQEYEQSKPPLCHADLYRLADPNELYELGLVDKREQGYLMIVEWGASAVSVLGGDALILTISREPRKVTLEATGTRSEEILNSLRELRPY